MICREKNTGIKQHGISDHGNEIKWMATTWLCVKCTRLAGSPCSLDLALHIPTGPGFHRVLCRGWTVRGGFWTQTPPWDLENSMAGIPRKGCFDTQHCRFTQAFAFLFPLSESSCALFPSPPCCFPTSPGLHVHTWSAALTVTAPFLWASQVPDLGQSPRH